VTGSARTGKKLAFSYQQLVKTAGFVTEGMAPIPCYMTCFLF